jgi:hypothetical protein
VCTAASFQPEKEVNSSRAAARMNSEDFILGKIRQTQNELVVSLMGGPRSSGSETGSRREAAEGTGGGGLVAGTTQGAEEAAARHTGCSPPPNSTLHGKDEKDRVMCVLPQL